jgi:hypothetical protein
LRRARSSPRLDKQESFKKFVGALITRRNHWNDLYYRDDPTILGWELANEPHMPGDDTGIVLKVWVSLISRRPTSSGIGVTRLTSQSNMQRLTICLFGNPAVTCCLCSALCSIALCSAQ